MIRGSLIFLVSILFCWQCTFAASGKSQQEQQESQKKLAELQQLLARAVQSSKNPGIGSELNQPGTPLTQSTSLQQDKMTLATSAAAGDAPAGDTAVADVPGNIIANTASAPMPKANLYDEAFSNVVNQMLPMSPQQVSKLREVFIDSQLAASTPPGVPPKPTSTSLLVSLSPQATPPVIRLSAGYITSLVFVDSTGQPWPIASYSIGDPSAFNIQWDRKGNTLLTQSSTFYKRSNLAVMLRDLNTPVMITLISGQQAVDYRVDLRIPGFGPNAVFVQNGIPDATNPVLLEVLNGVPPRGSKEIKVGGGDAQAWLLNDKLYLRTNLTIISPGWQSILSSIDGTHAYQLQPAPIILVLQKGKDKILTLKLEGLE
ncbi:MAG: DotH/IcmK family type IV secretion protein [Gammaproteobacteria bacterium]|nr:DotH/IcmK family type IV secretion protein [Gammaproteobacteria bacterium]